MDLPPVWDEAIAACLERDPVRRPQTARAVLERLEPKPGERVRFRSLNRRVPFVRPLLALVLVVSAVFVGLLLRRERHRALPFAILARGLAFDAVHADDDATLGFGVAIRNALRCALLGEVPVVGEALSLPTAEGQMTMGSGVAVLDGEPLHLEGRVRAERRGESQHLEVSVRIVDPATGRELFTATEGGATVELPDVIARLAARVRTAAHLPALQPSEPSARARQAILRIERELETGEASAALEDAERALPDAPRVLQLHMLHERALSALEMEISAGAVRRKLAAFGQAGDAQLQGRVAIAAGREDVIRVASQLEALVTAGSDSFTDDAELATALSLGQRADEARATCRRLLARAQTPAQKLVARTRELEVDNTSDQSGTVLAAYPAIVDEALRLGFQGLALQALKSGCSATADNDDEHARAPCERLRDLGRAQHRPEAVALAAVELTSLSSAEGSLSTYAELMARRVETEQLGSLDLLIVVQSLLAENASERDALADVDAHFDDAIAFARKEHEVNMLSTMLASRALMAGARGDLVNARRYRQQTYELTADNGNADMALFAHAQEVADDIDGGDLLSASKVFSTLKAPPGDGDMFTVRQFRSAEVSLYLEQGRTAELEAAMAQAKKDRPLTAYAWGAWLVPLERANVEYERGNPAAMEKAASEALVIAGTAASTTRGVPAQVLAALGRVQLGGAEPTPAEVATWRKSAASPPSRATRELLVVQLLSLRRLLGEDPVTLRTELDAMIARFGHPGTLMLAGLWARVERLRLDAKIHDPRLEAERAALVEDATALGYVLVARQAAAVPR